MQCPYCVCVLACTLCMQAKCWSGMQRPGNNTRICHLCTTPSGRVNSRSVPNKSIAHTHKLHARTYQTPSYTLPTTTSNMGFPWLTTLPKNDTWLGKTQVVRSTTQPLTCLQRKDRGKKKLQRKSYELCSSETLCFSIAFVDGRICTRHMKTLATSYIHNNQSNTVLTSTLKMLWICVSLAYTSNADAQNWITATEHVHISPTLNRNELISVPLSFIGCICNRHSFKQYTKSRRWSFIKHKEFNMYEATSTRLWLYGTSDRTIQVHKLQYSVWSGHHLQQIDASLFSTPIQLFSGKYAMHRTWYCIRTHPNTQLRSRVVDLLMPHLGIFDFYRW